MSGCFFLKHGVCDKNVPFYNTTSIYLINLVWELGLVLGLDLEMHYFSIFHRE